MLAVSNNDYVNGGTYDLTNNAAPMTTGAAGKFSFGGLTPDGAKVLTCGALPGSWPPNVPGVGVSGTHDSILVDSKTGATLPAPGFDGVIHKALTPAFSPDGKKVAFNHYDTGAGHSLAVMDFVDGSNTFSNLVDVATDNAHYLGWPAFLPDGKTLIYHQDSRSDYASWQGAKADLVAVDLATKTTALMDAANGMANGVTYLPYGATEQSLNYEPTVLPVAVGGYYWVLFTSRRYYGNTIVDASQDATPRKKLWVAAIDINAPAGQGRPATPRSISPSRTRPPATCAASGRSIPCKQNGSSCETGDECCGGYCRSDGDGGLACVPPPSGCAQEFEKCTTAADCCDTGSLCINGHCAKPPPN